MAALDVGHPDGLVPLRVGEARDAALPSQPRPVQGEADDSLFVEAEVAVYAGVDPPYPGQPFDQQFSVVVRPPVIGEPS